MTTRLRHSRRGFSLIEMIGVLAIMAIMASVIVPNALKSLDQAAIRAEAASLAAVGEQLKLYLRDNGAPPSIANWTTELATYADLSPADLLTNKRNNSRIYVVNAATERAMILSGMRAGLSLPTYNQVNNNFAAIWDTADGSVPTTAGWAAWSGTANAGDYLVIQRINLAPVYATALQSYPIALNNPSGSSAQFRIVYSAGTVAGPTVILAGQSVPAFTLRPRDRLDLYNTSGTLSYSYVISDSGKTFEYNGTQWLPQ